MVKKFNFTRDGDNSLLIPILNENRDQSKLFDGEETIKVEYPFTITPDIVKKLIKKVDEKMKIPFGMYV